MSKKITLFAAFLSIVMMIVGCNSETKPANPEPIDTVNAIGHAGHQYDDSIDILIGLSRIAMRDGDRRRSDSLFDAAQRMIARDGANGAGKHDEPEQAAKPAPTHEHRPVGIMSAPKRTARASAPAEKTDTVQNGPEPSIIESYGLKEPYTIYSGSYKPIQLHRAGKKPIDITSVEHDPNRIDATRGAEGIEYRDKKTGKLLFTLKRRQ